MKKDISELTVLEREAVANVFILVRDHMIATHDTPFYITFICTNILEVHSRELPKDDLPYRQAKDIIDLRIYYIEADHYANLLDRTIRGWLARKADITSEQRDRVYCTECLSYEYRIAWLTSLINECLGLPFETHYIESI